MMSALFGLRARIVLWVGALMALLLVIGLPAMGLLVSQREWRERQQIARGVDAVVAAWEEDEAASRAACDTLESLWSDLSVYVGEERICGQPPAPGALRIQREGTQGVAWVAHVQRGSALRTLRVESLAASVWLALLVFGTLVAIWRLISRWIVAPVHALRRASEQIAEGSHQVDLPALRGTELALLNDSFRQMASRLAEQRDEISEQLVALESANEELRHAQGQLVRSERLATAGRLSAGLAHEVGNPLSAVMGMIDALQRGGLSEEVHRDLLGRIQVELERIHTLLGQMLTFVRTPASVEATCRPGDVLQTVVALFSHDRRHDGIGVEIHAPEEGWREVRAPAEALQQVLLNLLLNACDALHAAGREAPILVRGEVEGQALVLRVEDEGEGMSEAVRKEATAPFFSTRSPGRGTGLGLAVCEQLITAWAGELRFKPRAERGLCVSFSIPLVELSEVDQTDVDDGNP